jgi:RNA polymerase sigma-70 factor (ECF subfamily)
MTAQESGSYQGISPAISNEVAFARVSTDRSEHAEAERLRAAQHDLDCFAPLYNRYAPRIYLYCLRRVGSAPEAEDLTSLTFTRALGALGDYQGGSVAVWLFTIARNAVTDHYRERQITRIPLEHVEDVLPDAHLPPVEQVIHAERCAHLRDLIAAFSEDEQELLALSISGELTSKEIGAVMGKRPGAVRMGLHRLLKRLRALCAEEVV